MPNNKERKRFLEEAHGSVRGELTAQAQRKHPEFHFRAVQCRVNAVKPAYFPEGLLGSQYGQALCDVQRPPPPQSHGPCRRLASWQVVQYLSSPGFQGACTVFLCPLPHRLLGVACLDPLPSWAPTNWTFPHSRFVFSQPWIPSGLRNPPPVEKRGSALNFPPEALHVGTSHFSTTPGRVTPVSASGGVRAPCSPHETTHSLLPIGSFVLLVVQPSSRQN